MSDVTLPEKMINGHKYYRYSYKGNAIMEKKIADEGMRWFEKNFTIDYMGRKASEMIMINEGGGYYSLWHRPLKPGKSTGCDCNFISKIKNGDLPDSMFDKHELDMGIEDEMEHTDDPEVAKAIAKGHLVKHPRYYSENDKKHCY